jgi:DNA-binding PadR family transcriptional regulator
MERLKNKTTRELLWVYLLRLLKERDMYAYEIRKRLEEEFGFSPALVTSYVVLYKLEREGYVTTRWNENKKYYSITPKGRELLREGVSYLQGMVDRLK